MASDLSGRVIILCILNPSFEKSWHRLYTIIEKSGSMIGVPKLIAYRGITLKIWYILWYHISVWNTVPDLFACSSFLQARTKHRSSSVCFIQIFKRDIILWSRQLMIDGGKRLDLDFIKRFTFIHIKIDKYR